MTGTRDPSRMPDISVTVQVIFYAELNGGPSGEMMASPQFIESVHDGARPEWTNRTLGGDEVVPQSIAFVYTVSDNHTVSAGFFPACNDPLWQLGRVHTRGRALGVSRLQAARQDRRLVQQAINPGDYSSQQRGVLSQ